MYTLLLLAIAAAATAGLEWKANLARCRAHLAFARAADATPPQPDPSTPDDPRSDCTCNGTGKSGDGLAPCPCGGPGHCKCTRKSAPPPLLPPQQQPAADFPQRNWPADVVTNNPPDDPTNSPTESDNSSDDATPPEPAPNTNQDADDKKWWEHERLRLFVDTGEASQEALAEMLRIERDEPAKWEIGPAPQNHIQLTTNPDTHTRWGVTEFPSVMRITGSTASKVVSSRGWRAEDYVEFLVSGTVPRTAGNNDADVQQIARRRQILFFTQNNCPPCRTITTKVFPQLRESGWTVSTGKNAHIRIIQFPNDAFERFDIEGTPTVILVVDGVAVARSADPDVMTAMWFVNLYQPSRRQSSQQTIQYPVERVIITTPYNMQTVPYVRQPLMRARPPQQLFSRWTCPVPNERIWTHPGDIRSHLLAHGWSPRQLAMVTDNLQLEYWHTWAHRGTYWPKPGE